MPKTVMRLPNVVKGLRRKKTAMKRVIRSLAVREQGELLLLPDGLLPPWHGIHKVFFSILTVDGTATSLFAIPGWDQDSSVSTGARVCTQIGAGTLQ